METASKNELAVTDRVFAGYLTGIPAKKSSEVRIFLSATSSDWYSERTWLMKTAVPQLRTFCQQRGLDFQIIDMRWGVKDTIADDHSTIDLCLQEIQKCQTLSVGPNFVALLGDKYGCRPLVPKIEASEFKLVKNAAIECGFDISLLTTWYMCDYNREPTMYVLQPISSLIPGFFDANPMNSLIQQQAQREWCTVKDKLQYLFRTATELLYKKNKISDETKQKYFQSAVESEVTAGILKSETIQSKTLCFQRTLNGISLEGGVRVADRFTDLVEKSIDYDAEKLREQLRLEKIRSVMTKDNLLRYNLLWDKHGLDTSEKSLHKSYLEKFGQDFLSLTKTMILNGIAQLSSLYGSFPLLDDTLHHLHLCKSLCSKFCGREMLLVEIRNKLRVIEHQQNVQTETKEQRPSEKSIINEGSPRMKTDDVIQISCNTEIPDSPERYTDNDKEEQIDKGESLSKIGYKGQSESSVNIVFGDASDDKEDVAKDINDELNTIAKATRFTTPLIIHGPSGSGKTAILAKVMELSKFWFPNCVSIIRFLGTSHMTSSIREVLVSLCLQISHVYNIPRSVGVDLNTSFQFLINYLKTLLWRISTSNRPLVIILDSVDQLASADHAHTFSWLPVKLPPNVHILVSVVSEKFNFLKHAKNVFPNSDRYIEITMLEKFSALDMINTILGKAGCHPAKKQINVLLDKFEQCGNALYQKILIDRAVQWKSYDSIEKEGIGSNVTEIINQLFDKLETDHSPVLVKHGLAFLCASRDGLTESEMEDLLSLDNEVLQDTYIHNVPPDPDVIRVPQLLWKRVHHDIREYLLERHFGGQRVVAWFHWQFMEAATSRYLTNGNEKQVHQLMAEYFQGVWNSKPKLLHLTKGIRGIFPNASREVPAQPLMFNDTVYNTRMLHCLPYHLVHCGSFATLVTQLFTDPQWLYAKCLTLSLTSLFEDFRLAEHKIADDIQCMRVAVSKVDPFIAGPKQRQELESTKTSLDDTLRIFEAMKLITKVVLLSSEQIRRDPMYLPLHVIGQLGPGYKGLSHVEKLVSRCVSWCKQFHMPLLIPLTDCLTKPGSNLLYTISVDMTLPGDWRFSDDRYQILFLQEDTNKLFVTQHQSDKPDQICVFDVVDNGSCIRVVDANKYVRSLKWTGQNKYLQVEEYTRKGAFHGKSDLFKSLTSSPEAFPHPPGVITLSATGRYVAFTSERKVYVCYGKKDFPIYYEIEDHTQEVTSLQVSPDNTLLLTTQREQDAMAEQSASLEGHARSLIFDLQSKKLLHEVETRLKITQNTLITKNNILVCTGSMEKGKVFCYDMVGGSVQHEVQLNDGFDINVLQLHASHQYALCGFKERSEDETEHGVSIKSLQVLRISEGTLHGVCPVQGSCAGITVFGTDFIYYAVCPMGDNVLHIYFVGHVSSPLQNGVLIYRLSGHTRPIMEILVPSSMDMLITASLDNIIKAWDLGIILNSFHSELTDIEKRLASLSRLEPSPGQIVSQFRYKDTAKRPVTTQLCLNMYGDSLYVGTDDGKLLRYCTETGTQKVKQDMDVGPVDIMLLSSNGQFVIVIGSKIHVEDLQSDKQLSFEPPGKVDCAAEANNVLVCGSTGPESRARVWNIQTGQVLRDINREYSFVCMVMNSTGTKIVTTVHDLPIVIPLDGSQSVEPDSTCSDVGMTQATCCDITYDDTLAAMGTDNGYVNVINMKGTNVYRLKQKSRVVALTFSPDGKALLTSGFKSIYVWSSDNGCLRYKLTRHVDLVTHLKFDPTGQFLLSFSVDKQLVLWDFARLVSIATFHTQCKIAGLDVAYRAETIAYIPEGAMDVAILKPNAVLQDVMDGNVKALALEPKAQALALAFSSPRAVRSAACSVM